jgi:hypothetical protein
VKFEDIVLSSFVYSGSSRKLAILAAANNPINTELVTQLVGYLDEEYLKPKEEAAPIKPAESRAKHAADKPDSKSAASQPKSSRSSFSIRDDSRSLASMFGDDVDEPEPEPESEPTIDDKTSTEPVEPESEVESSTQIPDTFESISASAAAALNAFDATAGVRSTKVQGNELWIYYKDDVNLNSVMESVIDSMPNSIVEFNRLARSHNAIVFTQRG